MKKLTMLSLITISFPIMIFSQALPHSINYQGILKNSSGAVAADGDYMMTFKLYDAETDGTELWKETKTVNILGGIINTQLGSNNPVVLPFEGQVWLGISIASESEMSPRIKLNSVPYSYTAMNVMNESVTSEKIANSTITAADIKSGEVVKSINSMKDDVSLVAGSNVTITPGSNTLTISASGGSGGTIGGDGTENYIPLFSSSTSLTSSVIYQKFGNIGIGTTNPLYPLQVSSPTTHAGYFTSNVLSSSARTIFTEYAGTGNYDGTGIYARSTPADGYGIGGMFIGGKTGLSARVIPAGNMVYHGVHSNVTGGSGTNYGIYAVATGGAVSYGVSGSGDYGVYGSGDCGVYGSGASYGLYGTAYDYGIYGQATNNTGYAVYGIGKTFAIEGKAKNTSGIADAVRGISNSTGGTGVFGYADAVSTIANYGGYFVSKSTAGVGVRGVANATTGTTYGGYFTSESTGGRGIYAYATTTTGTNYGIIGRSNSTSGYAIYGSANATSGRNYGVSGRSYSTDGIGVYGTGLKFGIEGYASNTSGIADGIRGISNSTGGTGVFAYAKTSSGLNYGLYAKTESPSGYAATFAGNCEVIGELYKGGGYFKIDHPLDPRNKFLYHSFVESPDMMNIYNGNIVTDGSGYASVTLPDWFEALNKDFRYQLTVIGEFAQAIISQKIQNNEFVIRTDKPGIEVSWQVTGIRKDAFAEQHRKPVEEEKTGEEIGRYLYPESFGLTKDQGIDAARRPMEIQTETTEPVINDEIELRKDIDSPEPSGVKIIQRD